MFLNYVVVTVSFVPVVVSKNYVGVCQNLDIIAVTSGMTMTSNSSVKTTILAQAQI
jgi:hypothetical protein